MIKQKDDWEYVKIRRTKKGVFKDIFIKKGKKLIKIKTEGPKFYM
jgi:hypothetical protein